MDRGTYYVTELKQLLALATAGREDIIDAVAILGPCTVPEIAKFVGRSRNALYYHVHALRDCGLLLESELRREGVKRTLQYDLPGRPLILKYNLSTPRSRRAVMKIGRIRFRSGERGFLRACKGERVVVEGPHRNLWAAHWKGWLTDKDLEKANRLLLELVDVFRHGADGSGDRKPIELTFGIAPVIPN
ncbi:MAG TPA: winged helix-turn-helix domain-containing protein [Gemmatimonadaceae bacterium]|nr:winged helix-turn-helix domain-containing protein [Gemmatimonadaceae bacterium]